MHIFYVVRAEWLRGGFRPDGVGRASHMWDYYEQHGCCLGHIGCALDVSMRGGSNDYYYPWEKTRLWPEGLFRDGSDGAIMAVRDFANSSLSYAPIISRLMAHVNDASNYPAVADAELNRPERENLLQRLALEADIDLRFVDTRAEVPHGDA